MRSAAAAATAAVHVVWQSLASLQQLTTRHTAGIRRVLRTIDRSAMEVLVASSLLAVCGPERED